MKALDKNDCFNCGQADLQPGTVELSGSIKGCAYKVEMQGLRCPNCGFQTIEGPAAMTEFRRLLADQYRREHGLLMGKDLIALRKALEMSQAEFAKHVGIGLATIKRCELGKIQDKRTNEQILAKTSVKATETLQYASAFALVSGTTMQCNLIGSTTMSSATGSMQVAANKYIKTITAAYRCRNCKQTAEAYQSFGPAETTSAPLATILLRGIHARQR